MSNKKRNVAYIKPEEPAFLRRLKQEAGFKEGPNIDTKREQLPCLSDDENEESTEDSPVVVVLKPGDLSKSEVDEAKKQQILEEANRPANLEDRIVFQKPSKKREAASIPDDRQSGKKKKSKALNNSKLLSFDEDEVDD